jgi:hypothetical protein
VTSPFIVSAGNQAKARTPFKKQDCAETNKQFLGDALAADRKARLDLKMTDFRARRDPVCLERAWSEGPRKVENDMAKQRAESDVEDLSVMGNDDDTSFTSMTGSSDDNKSLPATAGNLLFESYAEGKRSANVWDQRDIEEADDEVQFDGDFDEDI